MNPKYLIMLATGVALHNSPLAAQQQQRLAKADATFSESFSTVRGLLELDDGKLLISDGLGQALMLVDLDAGTADTIGRVGGGPQEYRAPDGLWPLPGGSILLVDLGNGRLSVMNSAFEVGQTYPIMGASTRPGFGGTLIRIPRGVDGTGKLYLQASGGMGPDGQLRDSATVVRWDPATDQVDTVAMVKEQDRELSTSGSPNNRNVSVSTIPLSPRDGWAASTDGRVALVRAGDYSVQWMHPDGTITQGPSNRYDPVRVGQAEKEAWVDQLGRNGLAISMMIQNGQRRASFSRGGPSSRGQSGVDSYSWPDAMPAFDASGIRIDPNGILWVQRSGKVDAEVLFDLFDEQGNMVKQVTLPPGREIVGFGKGVVYTATADEFDLMWLERFRVES